MYLAKQTTVLGLDLQGRGSLGRFLSEEGKGVAGVWVGMAVQLGSGKGLGGWSCSLREGLSLWAQGAGLAAVSRG